MKTACCISGCVGVFAALGFTEGAGGQESQYIFARIVGSGDPVPEAGGAIFPISFPNHVSINNRGDVFVHWHFATTNGLFRAECGGELQKIAFASDPVPGAPGFVFSLFRWAVLNDDGNVAFYAEFVVPDRGGFYESVDGSAPSRVVDTTSPVPARPGSYWVALNSEMGAYSAAGMLAFHGNFADRYGGPAGDGVYRRPGGGEVGRITDEGEPVPDQQQATWLFIDSPSVNVDGRVVFRAFSTPWG